MIIAIILLVLGWIEYRFSPRFEYIKESSVLLFFYSAKNTRKCLVVWEF